MIKAAATKLSKGWTYDAERGWNPALVQKYCVQDPQWQQIRLSMKNKPTVEKLIILDNWRETNLKAYDGKLPEAVQCQIDNYLGALRRGGQLDDQNRIRKYI